MATLFEWRERVNALWEEAERDGISWEFTTCCCGEGLILRDDRTGEKVEVY